MRPRALKNVRGLLRQSASIWFSPYYLQIKWTIQSRCTIVCGSRLRISPEFFYTTVPEPPGSQPIHVFVVLFQELLMPPPFLVRVTFLLRA